MVPQYSGLSLAISLPSIIVHPEEEALTLRSSPPEASLCTIFTSITSPAITPVGLEIVTVVPELFAVVAIPT